MLVTFLLDVSGQVVEQAITFVHDVPNESFLLDVRDTLISFIRRDIRPLRVEVNDKGTQTWLNVAEVLSLRD